MEPVSKIVFILVVCVAFEAIGASNGFDPYGILSYQANRIFYDVERDLMKDTQNIKSKISKDGMKIIKKVRGMNDIVSCVLQSQQEALEQVDASSARAQTCLADVKSSLNQETPNYMSFTTRRQIKDKAKACRDTAKTQSKMIQNQFSMNIRMCPNRPQQQQEDSFI